MLLIMPFDHVFPFWISSAFDNVVNFRLSPSSKKYIKGGRVFDTEK